MALIARNVNTGTVIADRVGVAATHAERAVGLLARDGLDPGEALWIVPSRGVHTCWMRFPIDVIALDERGVVIDRVAHLRPWRVRLPRRGTAGVLELPAGTVDRTGTCGRPSRGVRDGRGRQRSAGGRSRQRSGSRGMPVMSSAAAVATAAPPSAQPMPPAPPATVQESGLQPDVLSQLLLKTLVSGEASGTGLADRLCLPYSVLEALVQHARIEKLVEVRGTSGAGTAGYRYALTDLGRDRAGQFLDDQPVHRPGAGSARAVQRLRPRLHGGAARSSIASAWPAGFEHLVVSRPMLDRLGPAVNSGKSVFLYGAPGNGKTVVAEGIGHALGGDVHMPHAIDVDGQIITMFDPVNHQAIEAPTGPQSVIAAAAHDRRWQRIRRPIVVVGGELTLEMLDLTFNPIAKFYEGPIQLKANGGVFVVDDFGRQRIPPRDLLNRWIVPLESRVDFLTLHTGRKFEVPFNVLIVFATNLQPESLADEAFLRRIPYKILARNPTMDESCRIFEMNCRRRHLAFDPVMVEYLHRKYYQPRKLQMRACHPRDLLEQVVDLCRYQNREPVITRELLDAACSSYFLEEVSSQGSES